MLQPILNRLAGLIQASHDRVSRRLAAWRQNSRAAGWIWPFPKRPARLCLELFVAAALTVNLFYLVRTQCSIKFDGNCYSAYTFSYLAEHRTDDPSSLIPANWQTRLAAPALTAWLLNARLDDYRLAARKHSLIIDFYRSQDFQNVFGLYHASWVFLLFLLLILLRPDALLIILGVFAGLMYNLITPAGMYYYPWDMPALFFFTLACLLFDKGWMKSLIPVVVIGSLFKETILCCTLFLLFNPLWNWMKRTVAFLGAWLAASALSHLLMAHYHLKVSSDTWQGATLPGLFSGTLLAKNLHLLFSLNLNHVFFANAGALLIMMLIPWRSRRDVLFKFVILAFAAGQFLFGVIDEVRIWYELLPLGWLLVSEFLAAPAPASPSSATTARLFQVSHWITLTGLAVLVFSLWAVTRSDPTAKAIFTDAPPPIPAQTLADAQRGNAEAQFQLGMFNVMVRSHPAEAHEWFRQAAAQGHAAAKYNLGLMYWNGVGTAPNQAEALRLFRESARQDLEPAQLMLGKLCLQNPGATADLVEACQWLRLAQLQGNDEAATLLQQCLLRMTPDQIAAAEQQLKEYQRVKKPAP